MNTDKHFLLQYNVPVHYKRVSNNICDLRKNANNTPTESDHRQMTNKIMIPKCQSAFAGNKSQQQYK